MNRHEGRRKKARFCPECYARPICGLLNYTYYGTRYCLQVQINQKKQKPGLPQKVNPLEQMKFNFGGNEPEEGGNSD